MSGYSDFLEVEFHTDASSAENCICDACHRTGRVTKLQFPRTLYFDGHELSTRYSGYWLCAGCVEKLSHALKHPNVSVDKIVKSLPETGAFLNGQEKEQKIVEEMMGVQESIAMRLPDGSHIKVETCDGEYSDGNNQKQNWMSLDIYRVCPDGKNELLASIDFEKAKGLRTMVFDQAQDDPVFTKEDNDEK